jgi:competence protein ComEC
MRLAILAFVAGAALLQQQSSLFAVAPLWFSIAGLLLAALLLRRFSKFASHALLVIAAAVVGFAWASTLAAARLAQRLDPAWEGRDIVVTGRIADLPHADERGTRFLLDVERVSAVEGDAAAPIPAALGRITLTWYKPRHAAPEDNAAAELALQPGERWQFAVRLKRPHGTANPYTFDFERWALERNIGATGYVRDKPAPQRVDNEMWPLSYQVDRWRADIRARLLQALQGRPYAEVIVALAVGDQSGIAAAQWRLFWRSGIGHLISISGLHVTMVAGLFGWAAGWLWRRSSRLMLWLPAQRIAVLAGALAALAYAALAGFSVPTQRTVYMLAVVAAAWWFGWRLSPSQVLCAALLVVVLLDPWAVTAPGFWLSFGAVAAIFYVTADRLGQASKAAVALRTQMAVTLALAPLLLLLFHQLPLISPIANAVAIPLISLLVVPLTLLACAVPLDGLAQSAHALLSACMSVVEWLTQWPDAVWTRGSPPQWSVVLALAGVFWLMLPRGFPARWLGAIWLLPLALTPTARPGGGEFWVTVLDVGQGLSAVVETATRTLLYDAGPRYGDDANAGLRIALPYLRGRGLTRLDAVVVSHEDDDHVGGAFDVQAELRPWWLLSSLPPEYPVVAQAARALRCSAGQHWNWDGVRFDVLGPPREAYADARLRENGLSCVVRVSANGRSVLLPGDIEAPQEQSLVARYGDGLRSEVLIAPHHGSKTSSTAQFLAAVHARQIVVTVGYRNRFQHPHAEVVQRVLATGAQVLRTDRQGALALHFDARGVSVMSFRETVPRYWRE